MLHFCSSPQLNAVTFLIAKVGRGMCADTVTPAWRHAVVVLFICVACAASAETARIHVFVALADNASQGIAKVPAKIGNGDDPKNNLYWGCSDALPVILRASRNWKHVSTGPGAKASVLERAVFL